MKGRTTTTEIEVVNCDTSSESSLEIGKEDMNEDLLIGEDSYEEEETESAINMTENVLPSKYS